MRAVTGRIALLTGSFAVALVLAELVLRLVPARPAFGTWFEDEKRERIDYSQATARGLVLPFPGGPRERALWAPGSRFFICYKDGDRPYLDARGCVEVRVSKANIRDERETPYDKPLGEIRVVCLGDSFTFGWGVPEAMAWPRLVEGLLTQNGEYRCINCGASGAIYIDEYWLGLRDRFFRFEPDVVLVSICLNDVVYLSSPLGLFRQPAPGPSRLLDALFASSRQAHEAVLRRSMDLEPGRDWGQVLLGAVTGPAARTQLLARGIDPTCTWGSGVPQDALRAMRDFCRARAIRFGVVIWPLFQGLETEARYPFTTIHRVLREFCERESMPVLDLLPAFLGQDPLRLWVDYSDQHGNEIAQQLAAAPIARFVLGLGPPTSK